MTPLSTFPTLRLANTLLALANLKLIVSWDRTYKRAFLQPYRWLATIRRQRPLPAYKTHQTRSWVISLSLGSGAGYQQPWWNKLGRGPGAATGNGNGYDDYGKSHCGHPWPYHCNSAYCGNPWCNAQQWPIFGALFVTGLSFHLGWNARQKDGGLLVSLTNNGNGPYPSGSGTWKSLCLYGRRETGATAPYIFAAKGAS